MQPTAQCEKWLKVAANLRVDRKDNIAPYKPLLLLVVAELVHELDADGKQLRVAKLTDEQRNAQGQRLSAELNSLLSFSAFSLQHSAFFSHVP